MLLVRTENANHLLLMRTENADHLLLVRTENAQAAFPLKLARPPPQLELVATSNLELTPKHVFLNKAAQPIEASPK